jgi:hypothetical protein
MPLSKRSIIAASTLLIIGLFTFVSTGHRQQLSSVAQALERDARTAYHQAVDRTQLAAPVRYAPSSNHKQTPLQWRAASQPPVWDELPLRMDAEPLAATVVDPAIPLNPLPSPTAVAPLQSEPAALQEDPDVQIVQIPHFSNNEAAEQATKEESMTINVTPEDVEDFVALAGRDAIFAF